MKQGKFIAFEGPDGSGKSTQLKLCCDRLAALSKDFIVVREPGGTTFGESIRQILLSNSSKLDIRTELFLFMACRAQLLNEVICPALSEGKIVVTDRFLWSSAAYQGKGLGLGIDEVLQIGEVATDGIKPDLYVVIDVAPLIGLKRRGEHLDRIEARSVEFFTKVSSGYVELAKRFPERSILLDGEEAIETISEKIWTRIRDVLGYC